MKRKCKYLIGSKDAKKKIYLDSECAAEIYNYIKQDERHENKFKFIAEIILGGHRNPSVYDKEEINERCKGVTAMKFFKGQENDRIYCKEFTTVDGTFIVVAAILYLNKKTTKLTNKQISIIEKVGGYNYEI